MKQKGQASIEFLFLLSIAMLYISTVVLPAVEVSRIAAEDITQLAQTRMAAEKLANAIDSVATASGNAKQTITIFVPERGTIECGTQGISFEFLLVAGSKPLLEFTNCPAGATTPENCCGTVGTGADARNICNKSFATIDEFSCPIASVINLNFERGTTKEVEIEKTEDGINVSFTQ